jgi:hypothetical protein
METLKKFEIVIREHISEEEIKEIVKEKISNYLDDNIENTIKVALQYGFYEILPKKYLEKLPSIVEEKIKDITVTDIIGYADSFRNVEARNVINYSVSQNKEKITEILLKKFEEMDDWQAREILIEALRKVQK